MTYAIYDERFYLNSNPDVKAVVAAGGFASGLEHFQKLGIQEGRIAVSPFWNEQQYLALNPDVRNAVNTGVLRSGLQHFILSGEAEGRGGVPIIPPTAGFNEDYYLARYPEVGAAVAAGTFPSALSHFIAAGQFEDRQALYTGTSGNDIVTGVGPQNVITGVYLDVIANRGIPDSRPTSLGVGEVDLLVGGTGVDNFLLASERSGSNPTAQRFYVGRGNGDYAYIKNFTPGQDFVELAGRPSDYVQNSGSFAVTSNRASGVSISTNTGDLVAVVEGVQSLQLFLEDPNAGVFFLV